MYRVETFYEEYRSDLERKINEFIKNKNVVNVSYSTQMVGYSVHHYALVCYEI